MSGNQNQPSSSNQIAGALTFPTRNVENPQPLPEQPRQPTNLQGLLRFAMEATLAEDAPGDSRLAPMDEQRRRFLEEALSSLTVDMSVVIKSAIRTLSDQEVMRSIQLEDPVPNNVATAFENLLDLVDDIDIANDFYKMGGYAIFPICLGSENDDVRALGSTVLAEVCQNNPYCQDKALECGLLNVVLSLVQTDHGEPLVKELYALSSMCREYEPASRALLAAGGCGALALLLRAEEASARTKAAFLIRHLCHTYPDAKEKFINLNLVKEIAAQIKDGRDSTTEHLLSVILALIEDMNSTVVAQCMNPSVGLQNILEEHLKHPDLVDDSFTEEKEYCETLLKILATCPKIEVVEEVVDR